MNKEINTLISKITELPVTKKKIKSEKCPVHNKNLPQEVETRIVRKVQLSEALREIEIPRTLGKVFKLRHSFWELEDDPKKIIKTEKDARDDFRLFFQEMVNFYTKKIELQF